MNTSPARIGSRTRRPSKATAQRKAESRLALPGNWLFSFDSRFLEWVWYCTLWHRENSFESAHESRFRFRPFVHFRVRLHRPNHDTLAPGGLKQDKNCRCFNALRSMVVSEQDKDLSPVWDIACELLGGPDS